MKKENNPQAHDEVAEMIRGVPPKNILISFGDKHAKTMEEPMKDQQKKRKRKGSKEMER